MRNRKENMQAHVGAHTLRKQNTHNIQHVCKCYTYQLTHEILMPSLITRGVVIAPITRHRILHFLHTLGRTDRTVTDVNAVGLITISEMHPIKLIDLKYTQCVLEEADVINP